MNAQPASNDEGTRHRAANGRLPDHTVGLPRPDEWCEPKDAGGENRCALWWRSVPKLAGEKLGVIGAFSAKSHDAGEVLLRSALQILRHQGCTLAVGPMNRDTWHDYRFACGPRDDPPFFLEPASDEVGLATFRSAGFEVCLQSVSTVSEQLKNVVMPCAGLESRFARAGIHLRPLQPRQIESDLAGIYGVARLGFARNPFFTPVTAKEFLKTRRALAERIDPRHVLVATRGQQITGFVFIAPDYSELERQSGIDTAVFKTLCILPGDEYRGLGRLLLAKAVNIALELGYRRGIHALMHEPSRGLEMIASQSRLLRRYLLLSRRITG